MSCISVQLRSCYAFQTTFYQDLIYVNKGQDGTVLFNAGSNEQVVFVNSEKKIGADPSCRFREKR